MLVSWGSSQERVRALWLTWDVVSPVGAAGGSSSTGVFLDRVFLDRVFFDRLLCWLLLDRLRYGGDADPGGLGPVSLLAHGQDGIVVDGLGLHRGIGVLRTGASGVLLDGGQAVGVSPAQNAVSGYAGVLGVVPG